MSDKKEVATAGFGLDFGSLEEMDAEYTRLGLKPGAQAPSLRPGQAPADLQQLMEDDLRTATAGATRMN